MKIDILKRINRAMSPNKVDFSGVDAEINALKKKLEETVNIQTVDDVKYQLDKFKSKIDLAPLIQEIEKVGQVFTEKSKELQSQITEKTRELEAMKKSMNVMDERCMAEMKMVAKDISVLKNQLTEIEVIHEADVASLNQSITEVKAIEGRVNETITKLSQGLSIYSTKKEALTTIKETQDKIDELRRDILKRVGNIGGSMNRQIFIGGVDPLTRYTDINFKAGTNVTLTYANNNTTKKVDVTVAATGGAGTTRSINSTSVSSVIGAVAGTDYVTICTAGVQLTLPTAVGNENLYTIKNAAASSVLVAPDGVETIETYANIILATQYTA